MTLTANRLSEILKFELDKGYDVVRIARVACKLYNENVDSIDPKVDEILLQLMAMEEGPEFEFSEDELFFMLEDLVN